MKIVIALLLVLMVFSGCEEDLISPFNEGTDDVYGSSIVEIPGLALSKMAQKGQKYTFKLSITGPNMKSLDFTWQLGESGASFKIDRIPAGLSRVFKGVLYGTDGSTYEGSATATIYGGKVVHVRLVLTRTGGANVEVIIDEGIVEGGKFAGCWKLRGNVNAIDLGKFTLYIPEYRGEKFYGYIKEENKIVGKLGGTDLNGKIDADVSLHQYDLNARLQCSVAQEPRRFKGVIIPKDGSEESSVVGFKFECHPNGMFSGCWKLLGVINDIQMSKFSMEVKQYRGDLFYGYLKEEGGKIVGKFEGKEANGEFTIKYFQLPSPHNVTASLKGVIAPSVGQFKSVVYSLDGTSKIGQFGGSSIECKKDPPPPPPPPSDLLTGCWNLMGVVNDIHLSKFTLEIPKYSGSFGGYIKEGDNKIGKFSGTEFYGKIKANFYLPSPYDIDAQFTGSISSEGNEFKGVMVVASDGSSRSYKIEGHATNCYGDSPP